jgi:hypothetical protein
MSGKRNEGEAGRVPLKQTIYHFTKADILSSDERIEKKLEEAPRLLHGLTDHRYISLVERGLSGHVQSPGNC